jgi:hypothetical protein
MTSGADTEPSNTHIAKPKTNDDPMTSSLFFGFFVWNEELVGIPSPAH